MPRGPNIFAMLREGRVAEALEAARPAFEAEPGNVWNLRALVRALCKSIWESQDASQAQELAQELSALPALPAGEDDAQLTAYRERCVQRADPLGQRMFQIREVSKKGAHKEAMEQLRRLHRDHPQRLEVDEALAWEIWYALVEALKANEPDKGIIRTLALEYRSLRVKKPSVIHSRLLDVIARAAHEDAFPTFCGFLAWWDPAHLRDEDFERNKGKDGGSFPSVVERTISGLGKSLKKEPNTKLIAFAREFIAKNHVRYPDQEWFPYYLAIAMIRSGGAEEAKALLIPIVRKKQSESWAWHHLAECFPKGDVARLACLCRAVLCRVKEPQMLLGVRWDLALELVDAEHTNEAKQEIDSIIRTRKEKGWPLPPDVEEMTRSSWYQSALAKADGNLYRNYASQAAKVLAAGLPWEEAVLGAKNIVIGEHKERFAILDVRGDAGQVASMAVKMSALGDLTNDPVGSPLAVQVDRTSPRATLVGLQRRNGRAWDILPRMRAIILRVNEAKGITTMCTERGDECFYHHADLGSGDIILAGTVVSCVTIKDAKRIRVRDVEVLDGPQADSEHWKSFNGAFRPREKGGGHVTNVFVHARLAGNISAGDMVCGMAFREKNKDTGSSWWEAITAKADRTGRETGFTETSNEHSEAVG